MKIYINDLVKGHSDVKVKCLTFGLYTQVSDSGPLGPLVYADRAMGPFRVKMSNMLLLFFRQCHMQCTFTTSSMWSLTTFSS